MHDEVNPIAYTNPARVLDAFDIDEVWINGTAMQVKGDSSCPLDRVMIRHADGHVTAHRLPMKAPPEQSPTTTTCARCSHVFTSRLDGFVDEALENEIAAHHERCFVAGEAIRWYPDGCNADGDLIHVDCFIEGTIVGTGLTLLKVTSVAGRCDGIFGRPHVGSTMDWSISPGTRRRIPRPQQGEAKPTGGSSTFATPPPVPPEVWSDSDVLYDRAVKHLAATPLPEHHAARIRAMAERCRQPAPVLYDGLTAEQCLERDRQRRQEDSTSAWRSHVRPSADQRAVVSAHWSAQLRAKLAASDEVERCRVRVQLQCDEDEPW